MKYASRARIAYDAYIASMIDCCKESPIGISRFIGALLACEFVLPADWRCNGREKVSERFREFREKRLDEQSGPDFPLREWLAAITTVHFPGGE